MRNLEKSSFIVFSLVFLFIGVFLAFTADGLPGITGEDEFVNGCVSCHVQSGNEDGRVNNILSNFENHPSVTKIVNNVPGDCMMCHGKDSYGGELSKIIHEKHFSSPKSNDFVNTYKGACLNCHSMNVINGSVTIKSGPKNW